MSEAKDRSGSRRESTQETALEWVTRVEARDASSEDLNAFGDWLATDPGHEAAYAKADQLWSELGQTISREGLKSYEDRTSEEATGTHVPTTSVFRRHRRTAGFALAASLLAAVSVWVINAGKLAPQSFEGNYASAVGETQTVSLPDGSSIILGAASRIAVALSSTDRSIELRAGEAFFDVTPDSDRPFTVVAGDVRVRVTGTAFDVQRKGRVTQVAVAEGHVRVRNPAQIAAPATISSAKGNHASADPVIVNQTATLTAGERVVAVENEGLGAVESVAVTRIGAWRKNRLVYRDVPLSAIVEDLNRHDPRHFEIADERAGQIEVSANFDSSDIDSVLSSLAELAPIAIDQGQSDAIILRSRD